MKKRFSIKQALVFALIWFTIGLAWMIFSFLHEPKISPNKFYFKGTIQKVIRSNNHCFSIMIINLDTAFVRVIDSEAYKPNSGEFPAFRYRGKIGELYNFAGCEQDYIGFLITSDTTRQNVEILNKKGEVVEKGVLYPITEDYNINFIKTHSIFSTRTGSQCEK